MTFEYEQAERMANGEICAMCKRPFAEEQDGVRACWDCGGDALLEEDMENEDY